MFPFLNCGISFIKVGILISIIFSIFKPIVSIIEAIIRLKYAGAKFEKTFPVIAQIMPINPNTIALPRIKNNISINVFCGVDFEYPPTYPIINGKIDSEQGEIDATIPPSKEMLTNSIIDVS
ncbi:MAG: hypothetical protein MJ229_03920 [bacterium]|nr:hypothetical protein [bacterium]